jgi:hypothetical protein
MRISSHGGRFHAAIHASPHGSLFVNQRPFGSTPIAAAPLSPGRQVIGIRALDGKETRLTLELAQ